MNGILQPFSKRPQAKGASGIPPYAYKKPPYALLVNSFFQGHEAIFQHLDIPVIPQHTHELRSTSSAVWHFNRVIPKSLCHLVIHLLFLSRVYSSDITDKLCVGVKVTVPGCVKEHMESKVRSSWVCMSARKRRERERASKADSVSEKARESRDRCLEIMGSIMPLRKRVSCW